MSSNLSIAFTPEAEDDIRQILQYTLESWGEGKQEEYLAAFEKAFDTLSRFPRIRPIVLYNCRVQRVEQHLLLYQIREDDLQIIRVVHLRADIRSYILGFFGARSEFDEQ